MTRFLPQFAVLLAGAFLSACASCCKPSNDLVVVLPASDGHIGGVVVEGYGGEIVLDKAYAGARPGMSGSAPLEIPAKEVEEIFGNALSARPIPPKSYTLYFKSGRDELVPSSRATLKAMFREIAQRKAAEIVITGHTDTMGPSEDNDTLSLDRAKAVEKQLHDRLGERGIGSDSITTAGRGEREPLVATADQVAEGRNRRVEITVR